jgi:hypothetical protein
MIESNISNATHGNCEKSINTGKSGVVSLHHFCGSQDLAFRNI